MERLERTRKVLNRIVEPLRSETPEPPGADADPDSPVFEHFDADDPHNT